MFPSINKIKNNLKAIALSVALSIGGLHASAQARELPDISVHASLDTAAVTMGDRTVLHIEVLKNAHPGVLVDLPKAEPGKSIITLGSAEVRDISVDSIDVGNGRIQLNYNLIIQPFEVGMLSIAPLKYASQGDTAYSEIVSLKVNEPEIPKEMRDSLLINPMVGTVSIPAHWYDVIPEWWPWVLLAIGILAIAAAIIYLYKKNGPSLLPRKKVIPPYVLAMSRLDALKRRKLAESGQEKEYYTQLTDILREYLEGRFHIYAREMTTSQIIDAMVNNPETNPFTDQMLPMLETADFVKFAKQTPMPNENIRAFATVHDFVRDTKPAEEEQSGKKQEKNHTQTQN